MEKNTAALEFLLTRRSRPQKTLIAPVPTRDQLTPILTAAARTPDHGKLEPWRFIVLEKGALRRLGDLARTRAARSGKSAPPGTPAKVSVPPSARTTDRSPPDPT